MTASHDIDDDDTTVVNLPEASPPGSDRPVLSIPTADSSTVFSMNARLPLDRPRNDELGQIADPVPGFHPLELLPAFRTPERMRFVQASGSGKGGGARAIISMRLFHLVLVSL